MSTNNNKTQLPDIEKVCSKVHADWIKDKEAKGINTKMSDTGEELMQPYEQLSDTAKENIRNKVNSVYTAIEEVTTEEQQQHQHQSAGTM